jgi:hypothetical protein
MPMNPRLLRPSTKASASAAPRITTESGAAIKTESGDKIRTEQD